MAKEMTLVLACTATSDYGDNPSYASVLLTEEFVAKMEKVNEVCKENDLAGAQICMCPDYWSGGDELRLRDDEVNIWGGSMFFRARPKHAGYDVETYWIEIKDLRELMTKGSAEGFAVEDGVAYFPEDQEDYLSEAYLSDQEENEVDEEAEADVIS